MLSRMMLMQMIHFIRENFSFQGQSLPTGLVLPYSGGLDQKETKNMPEANAFDCIM